MVEEYKILVSKETNRLIQELLFKNGYRWSSGTNIMFEDEAIGNYYIFFDPNNTRGPMSWLGYTSGVSTIAEEISLKEFIDKFGFKEKLKLI